MIAGKESAWDRSSYPGGIWQWTIPSFPGNTIVHQRPGEAGAHSHTVVCVVDAENHRRQGREVR